MPQHKDKEFFESSLAILDKLAQCREVFHSKTPYNEIQIVEDDDARYLLFLKNGRISLQGGMSFDNPRFPIIPYYESSVDVIGEIPSDGNALCIGLGAGYIPKEIKLRTGCNVEVVEIDDEVDATARKYFDLPKDILVHIGDGFDFIANAKRKYDLIIADAYNGNQIPFHLVTKEFFQKCKDVLTDDGVFSVNFSTTHYFYDTHLNTVMSVFGDEMYINEKMYNAIVYNKRAHKDDGKPKGFSTRKIKMAEAIENSQIFSMRSV